MRKAYTDEERKIIIEKVDALKKEMSVTDACKEVGVAPYSYHVWKTGKKPTKKKQPKVEIYPPIMAPSNTIEKRISGKPQVSKSKAVIIIADIGEIFIHAKELFK